MGEFRKKLSAAISELKPEELVPKNLTPGSSSGEAVPGTRPLRTLVNSIPGHPNNQVEGLRRRQQEWDEAARDLGRQGYSKTAIQGEIGPRPEE